MGYILHVARTQATPHEVETFIANIAGQDSRSVPVVLQQEPGSGSALWIDSMRRGVLLGYTVYADQVKGAKFERSQPFRAAAEAGNIRLLRAAWNEAFLEECELFSPDEREYEHDDQVDAACGGFNYLVSGQTAALTDEDRAFLTTALQTLHVAFESRHGGSSPAPGEMRNTAREQYGDDDALALRQFRRSRRLRGW